jgi:Tfp pilus assembly protein PilV
MVKMAKTRKIKKYYELGQIIIIAVVVLAIILIMAGSLIGYSVQHLKYERTAVHKEQALVLAQAGIDKAIYELNQNQNYTGETGTAMTGIGQFSVSVANIDMMAKRITVTGYAPSSANPVATSIVKATAVIDTTSVSFQFGIQVGEGGLTMANGSRVEGNIFSNGPISGSGTVTGTAVVGGAAGSITGITVNKDARAASMSNCRVGGDAYFQGATTNCSVTGAKHPGTAPEATSTMPIADSQISDWEATAESYGTTGSKTLSGVNNYLGPIKINGNLTLINNAILYVTGPIWVNGNIIVGNDCLVQVDPTVGNASAVIIADTPANRSAGGQIDTGNNSIMIGNGHKDSYLLAVSGHQGANAIDVSNNMTGVIFYAANGVINLSNNAGGNQLTGYGINLNNNAVVTYLVGLRNVVFASGPGGSWKYQNGSYVIVE